MTGLGGWRGGGGANRMTDTQTDGLIQQPLNNGKTDHVANLGWVDRAVPVDGAA